MLQKLPLLNLVPRRKLETLKAKNQKSNDNKGENLDAGESNNKSERDNNNEGDMVKPRKAIVRMARMTLRMMIRIRKAEGM